MYEREREELRAEYGPRVAFAPDHEIAQILAVRNSPGYKAGLSLKEEHDRAARMAENATKAKIEAQRTEAAAEAAQRLEHRRRVLLTDWLRDGGDEQSFNDAWPGMRDDILTGQARQRHEEQERATRRRYQGMF